MKSPKLIHMHVSPWSERVRWGLKSKSITYDQQVYQPGLDEEGLISMSGQNQVPVLVIEEEVIPDSTRILDWLEEHHPDPALLPISESDRAEVVLWEELMENAFGPEARLLIVGRMLSSGIEELEQGGQFFSQKYGHTPYAENLSAWKVRRILEALTAIVKERRYLVGGSFTRADLTVASMLGLVQPAPDELFMFPEPLRSMFTEPLASESTFRAVFQWRDDMYRMHRGEIVVSETT